LNCQEIFKNFYIEKYTGRALKWQNQLSQCTLKANFPLGKKELQVSLFQSVVLLLFNDEEKLTFKEIKENSGLSEKELKRTLQSLSVAKIHILKKNPSTKEVNDDDEFYYNDKFEHQLIRIRINAVQHQETKEEKEEVNAKVLMERQYAIDATVVRIMKARKRLSHNLLLSEVFKQLKFPLKSSDVKKRIESLIERDYIERENEGSECFYNYQA
jgi:cullin 4